MKKDALEQYLKEHAIPRTTYLYWREVHKFNPKWYQQQQGRTPSRIRQLVRQEFARGMERHMIDCHGKMEEDHEEI
jgi:hypothetical protein